MKYFTKYLPVEGKPEDGDYIIMEEGNIGLFNKALIDRLNRPKEEKEKFLNSIKKAKLFLCSRDIQVGDEVYDDYSLTKNKIIELGKNDHLILENDNISYAEQRTYFKVIGEISPQAIWVKEGMEFDEENIQLEYDLRPRSNWMDIHKQAIDTVTGRQSTVRPYAPTFSAKRWKIIDPDYLVKIKCPTCKTFH